MRKIVVIIFSLTIVVTACLFYFRVEGASQPPKVSTLGIRLEKVEEFLETQAFVFCDGAVLISPTSGRVSWLKKEGEKVKRGSIVAKVGDKSVVAEKSGILLCKVDELSGLFKVEEVWEKENFEFFPGKISVIEDGVFVKAGAPIGEIRDNLSIKLVVKVNREDFYAKWLEGRRISVSFPTLKKEVEGKLLEIKPMGNDFLILLSLAGWDELVGFRSISVRLIKRKFMGAIVPINAIIIKDGKTGVYMVRGGRVFFKEIKFKELSSALVITSDLKDGDRIVVEPDKVSEGAFIRW